MVSKLPNPQTYEQILGDILATFMAKIGVNDLNIGSANRSFFEAMAQAVYRASGDTFAIYRDFSVDRAKGEALQRLREEENLPAITARISTGPVTISDSTITKISTKVYAGTAPPNIGSTEVNVSDASLFTASGSIYIGRGTSNVEGPISYSSIINVGSFYTINLDTPTTKYHNNSESVILAQGGTRNISAGTGVKTLSSGSAPDVTFITTKAATILDGEDTVTGVGVAATEPGTDGNVPRNAIREFVNSPFTGATVTNPGPFITGRNVESDDEIKTRIKRSRISKGLGTKLAVKNSVINAQAPDEDAVVTSDEIFTDGNITTLFIDNGEGYEEVTLGVGLEFIVDSALGGEQSFQLATAGSQTSIAKASLVSTEISPFSIFQNNRLALLVGGILSEHVFADGDFRSEGFATAFEVVASINANPSLIFAARTIQNGTKVSLSAKSETDEYIEKTDPTIGDDAGTALGLSATESQTLRLYKNDIPLSRNGRSATLESKNQSDWLPTITSGDTLKITVDSTAQITYTIINQDFSDEGTHTTVASTNTLQSWINVLNSKITGVTATINGNRIVLTSNLGTNSRSELSIDPTSTLVTKGMFDIDGVLSASGDEADFTLSRNTAQVKLTQPLAAGDSLTAGSDFTEGAITSGLILGGSLTLASDAYLWFVIDNQNASIIPNGVVSDSLIDVTKQGSNTIRYRSALPNAFSSVQAGDYVIVWTEELNAANRIEGRVYEVGTDAEPDDYFEIRVTASEYAAAVAEPSVIFQSGLVFIRSDIPPQRAVISTGSYNINTIASSIEDQILGLDANTQNDENIILSTTNKSYNGSVLLVTFNDAAQGLNFTSGDSGVSTFSHFGFFLNNESATGFPLFIHGSFVQDRIANPPTTLIPDFETTENLTTLGVDPNVFVCAQNPYLSAGLFVNDAQSYDECVQIDSISGGTTINIDDTTTIKRVRVSDRFYLLDTLNFDFDDDVIVVVDNNPAEKTFPINLYRRAITNTTTPINSDEFRAYDTDAGTTTEFSQFFGSTYNFKNYKAMMRARNVIDPTPLTDEDAILYRAAVWGRSGEKYNVGYIYPTAPNASISHSINIATKVKIRISLKSGAAVANNIDGTTEWDVTITPNTPVVGVDEVTYTHNGTGTNPAMATLTTGDYVTINGNGEFSTENQGTFRISAATSTSFTVRRPNGAAVAENNIATLTTNTISLYEDSDTTADEIVTYVEDNLTDWIVAELIDDNGSTGAGIINLSTYEDNDFASNSESVSFVDGLNWIQTSTLGASAPNAQFEFKQTLSLPSYDTNTTEAYAFNDGEEVRLLPTTIAQLTEFISVLAVTGLQTLGEIKSTLRDQRLQLATQILGSNGSIKVSGGTGNSTNATIIGTSNRVSDSDEMKTSIAKSASSGLNADTWVKLTASTKQKKTTGISFTTQVTITPNQPTATESIVEFSNKDVTDRYFGYPRNHVRDRLRAFHVEKHGNLVNISWDGITGSNPIFSKTVEFNDAGGGNMSVNFNTDSGSTEYIVLSGDRNFSEVQIGDTVVIQNFSDSENNGTFLINGISDDGLTLSVDNTEGVSAGSASVSAGDIVISTEIDEGDTVEIGDPFSSLNQGTFRVIRRYANSIYIDNTSAIEERVTVVDNLRSLGFDATTEFDVDISSGVMRVEWNTNGTEPTLENTKMGDVVTVGTAFNVANQGNFMVLSSGDNYIELANSLSVAETSITVSSVGGNVLESHIPSMVFSPYNNTRAGDSLVISGDVLDEGNQGTYLVNEVLSKNKIVVNDILISQTNEQLNSLFVQVFVLEGQAYVGYKKISSRAIDPANSQRVCLLFDTDLQFDKINEAASVGISAMSKLGFTTDIVLGFDAYRYHTGLLRQANKIVYGDPRDDITFPGVAAAGAEIFIDPPLVRRIEVSISIRVRTGTPFVRIAEQVRNNIAALINSSPIGKSIAISDIIATVNTIPGVKAVSINSPTYDPSNDVIVINPAEKPYVLDVVNDIQVNKVG